MAAGHAYSKKAAARKCGDAQLGRGWGAPICDTFGVGNGMAPPGIVANS